MLTSKGSLQTSYSLQSFFMIVKMTNTEHDSMFVLDKDETLAICMAVLPCVLPRVAFKLLNLYKSILMIVKMEQTHNHES